MKTSEKTPESFLSLTFDPEAAETAWYVLQRFEGSGPGLGYNVWVRMSDGTEYDIKVISVDYDDDGQMAVIGDLLDEDYEPTGEQVVAPFWSETGKPVLEIVHVF